MTNRSRYLYRFTSGTYILLTNRTNSYLTGFMVCSIGGKNYVGLVRSRSLEADLNPALYQTSILPTCLLKHTRVNADEHNFHLSQKKLLFTAIGNCCRKPQLVIKETNRYGKPGPNRYIQSTTPASEAQGALRKKSWGNCENQKTSKSPVR